MKRMKWEVYWNLHSPAYQSLVVEFYHNIRVYGLNPYQFVSSIQGKEIIVNFEILNELLEVHNSGRVLFYTNGFLNVAEFPKDSYMILGNLNKDLYSTSFDEYPRYLHYILVTYVVLKKFSPNAASKHELCILWHILENKPLNTASIIMGHMINLRLN